MLARRTFNIKSLTGQSFSLPYAYIKVGQETRGRNYENCLQIQKQPSRGVT